MRDCFSALDRRNFDVNVNSVELKPSAGIKFTVKRQSLWPATNNVLGSTDTYDLGRLIEMQGKNDKETCK